MAETQGTGASIVRSEFSADQIQVQHETAATAVAAAEKAAIEARHILAKKFPRDWDLVLQRLKKECLRPGFADAAIYRKPVGKEKNKRTGEWEDKSVEGLSVRFAEAAIRHVGNLYVSGKSIYNDDKTLIMRVTTMDLETNATIEIDFTVSKTVEKRSLKKGQQPLSRRINSYGDEVYRVEATDDEVLNKTNAQLSKNIRNGVLRLLPGDIQDECERLCRRTQADRDKADPDAAKRALFDAFADLGVMPDQLKAYLETSAESLQPAELAKLRAIYAAIRDSETTWAEVMESKEQASAVTASDVQKSGAPAAKTPAASKVDELLKKHQDKTQAKNGAKPEGGQGAPAGKSEPPPMSAGKAAAPGQQPVGVEQKAPLHADGDGVVPLGDQAQVFVDAFKQAETTDDIAAIKRDLVAVWSGLGKNEQAAVNAAEVAAKARLQEG